MTNQVHCQEVVIILLQKSLQPTYLACCSTKENLLAFCQKPFHFREGLPCISLHILAALYCFQRIRDEAHRFAITYHRKLRGKKATESILDEIKGLSKTNKEILMNQLKDIKKILFIRILIHLVGVVIVNFLLCLLIILNENQQHNK